MAVTKFYDAVVLIGGSGGPPPTGGTSIPHVRSVTLDYNAEMLDITEMGSGATRLNASGMLTWTASVNVLQDYAGGSIDALLFPLLGGVKFYIQIKPANAARSADNPEYWGYCVLETYQPFTGAVGDAQEVSASFQAAGALARNVTP